MKKMKPEKIKLDDIQISSIVSNEQFEQCLEVTKLAWKGIPEIEQIPPHIMKASSRTGQFLIAMLEEQVIGYSMSFSQLPDSLYLHAMGVKNDFQSRGVGEIIMNAMREDAKEKGYKTITFTFHPLLGGNANLYIHKMGGKVFTYEEDAYGKTYNETTGGEAPSDRLLVEIDILSELPTRLPVKSIDDLIGEKVNNIDYDEDIPRIDSTNFDADTKAYFLEIPADFGVVKSAGVEHEVDFTLTFRKLFQTYLQKGPITDFITIVQNGQRRNFYKIESYSEE